MTVKSLLYHDQGCCLDMSQRGSGYTIEYTILYTRGPTAGLCVR